MAMAMALAGSSCSTMKGASKPLRVGVTPNYPPLIQMQGEKAAGVECDFAVQLSSELGRPLMLMPVPWELQMDELLAGNIDIIMSGMTITPPRQARVAFCNSYMDNPLIAVTRRSESGGYPSVEAVLGASASMGVLAGTSADAFVRRYCPNAKVLPLSSRDDVVFYLANQRIDLYIDDLAAAVGIVSRNEARLELVRIPLASQTLAWAVRPQDEELLKQANEALARWRANGLLDQILDRWMPYRPQLVGTALQM
jgi:ABC-type amino acid transport substrate-binding protein